MVVYNCGRDKGYKPERFHSVTPIMKLIDPFCKSSEWLVQTIEISSEFEPNSVFQGFKCSPSLNREFLTNASHLSL